MRRLQTTDTVFMVRPSKFGVNPDTLADNYFQRPDSAKKNDAEEALKEFDAMVKLLEDAGITVIVVDDTPNPYTPDSIFPNNWFVTNSDGVLSLFPMHAPNRQLEPEKQELFGPVVRAFQPKKILDLRKVSFNTLGGSLESTGAMVIDRLNSVVYACQSQRISPEIFDYFCNERGYEPFLFDAYDNEGRPIYHTNVMMAIGKSIAVLCLEAVAPQQRNKLVDKLQQTRHELLEITMEQMYAFAGNMLFLHTRQGKPCVVMSQTAYKSLTPSQLTQLNDYKIIAPELGTIERLGGGSARCMMAEIFRHNDRKEPLE